MQIPYGNLPISITQIFLCKVSIGLTARYKQRWTWKPLNNYLKQWIQPDGHNHLEIEILLFYFDYLQSSLMQSIFSMYSPVLISKHVHHVSYQNILQSELGYSIIKFPKWLLILLGLSFTFSYSSYINSSKWRRTRPLWHLFSCLPPWEMSSYSPCEAPVFFLKFYFLSLSVPLSSCHVSFFCLSPTSLWIVLIQPLVFSKNTLYYPELYLPYSLFS